MNFLHKYKGLDKEKLALFVIIYFCINLFCSAQNLKLYYSYGDFNDKATDSNRYVLTSPSGLIGLEYKTQFSKDLNIIMGIAGFNRVYELKKELDTNSYIGAIAKKEMLYIDFPFGLEYDKAIDKKFSINAQIQFIPSVLIVGTRTLQGIYPITNANSAYKLFRDNATSWGLLIGASYELIENCKLHLTTRFRRTIYRYILSDHTLSKYLSFSIGVSYNFDK